MADPVSDPVTLAGNPGGYGSYVLEQLSTFGAVSPESFTVSLSECARQRQSLDAPLQPTTHPRGLARIGVSTLKFSVCVCGRVEPRTRLKHLAFYPVNSKLARPLHIRLIDHSRP